MAIVLIFATTSVGLARTNLLHHRVLDDGPFRPVSLDLFDFIRTNTAADSIVAFYKPRAMRLLTDRDALLINDCDELGKGHYAVIDKKVNTPDQVSPDRVATCNASLSLTPVFDNQEYVVYRIGPRH